MKQLFKDIHKGGHEIGIHGSYESFDNAKILEQEIATLKLTLSDLNIPIERLKSRQHYLRWDQLQTPQILDRAGIHSDSSLAFADHAGFRCGTSRSFRMFDLAANQSLSLIQQPLIMMETTIFGEHYQNLNLDDDGLRYVLDLKHTSLRIGKQFTFLWHNCSFDNDNGFDFYSQLVRN